MQLVEPIVWTATSFVGSLGSLALWFHLDLDDRWRLRKVKRARRLEERERLRSNRDLEHHMQLLEEERKRELEREWP